MARLRIACVQLSPCFKDVEGSIERAERLIERVQQGTLDLLVLPEMAFTGYCFQSREDVEPFVEDPETGRTAMWARKTAQRLGCYVLVGAPTTSPVPAVASSSSPTSPPSFFNSLLVVAPSGRLVTSYHKHFLYETDEAWATPGTSFVTLDLPFSPSSPFSTSLSSPDSPPPTFRLCPSICMDLNPYRFTAPFTAFELGSFAAREKADVVVCSMAWLDPEPPFTEGEKKKERGDEEGWDSVAQTLGYWALRVDPLEGSGAALVCCNRVGREGDTIFTGSSAIFRLEDSPAVLAFAGKRKEGLITGTVSLPQRV